MRKELVLEGLDCAHCAARIEQRVNQISEVKAANVNFVSKTLSFETDLADRLSDILSEIHQIVVKIEPTVAIRDKNITHSGAKIFAMVGLDCANCAAKIETRVRNIAGITNATVNFAAKKLFIEYHDKNELGRIATEVREIVGKIEPDVVIQELDNLTTKSESQQEQDPTSPLRLYLIRLGVGTILFFVGLAIKFSLTVELALFLVSYLMVGGEVLTRAFKNMLQGQVFDENFLMSVATIGAFAIGQYPEGVAVMLFYNVGELFQSLAVNRSRKSIASLMEIRPDYANLKVADGISKVAPETVEVGDVIVVKAGERIPLDGTIIEGKSMLDTSALTGESVPREAGVGGEVLAGSINKNGLLHIEVSKEFGDSTVSKILDLVQNATNRKSPTENFITKFARFYTPIVVGIAVIIAIIPPLLMPEATFSEWIYRALVFLVVSCPCALVISIPLGFFGGIGAASRHGVLVKGSNYLEALNNVEIVVFDKTGTLTKGVFKVTEIHATNNFNNDDLLQYAAMAEVFSNHPIAESILQAYNKEVDKDQIETYEEISGHGIKAKVTGTEILAGNAKLMMSEGIDFAAIETVGTVVHLAVNKIYAGYLVISDEIKGDAQKAIRELKGLGIKQTAMLTGDSKAVGVKVAELVGLDQVYAELLPHEKVAKIELLNQQKSAKGKLIFVGDGINDAPVLARADIGIAMGCAGSDAAIEAADVVIMTDEPSKLVSGIKIAKRTRKIVLENILFAFTVKLIVLILGAGGLATIWEAVFADVGVTLIAVLNSIRVIKIQALR